MPKALCKSGLRAEALGYPTEQEGKEKRCIVQAQEKPYKQNTTQHLTLTYTGVLERGLGASPPPTPQGHLHLKSRVSGAERPF